MRTLVHVTHEAIIKVGGIGAVLQGLLTCRAYCEREQRSILIGPLFAHEGGRSRPLGPGGEVLYSSLESVAPHPVSQALDQVRRDYHVEIVYGHRSFDDPHGKNKVSPEVVLIDVSRMNVHHVNTFKRRLWEAYGLDSKLHEHSWEYDLYLKLAEPALAVLRALGAADPGDHCVIFAHEFMGLPTALAAAMDPGDVFRTVFHAHEVSAMRRIVEEHPGHDVTFYNALSRAMAEEHYLDDVFGSQDSYYRHALVKTSRHCDRIFSVGDHVTKELRFIGPEFANAKIETVYNGIPSEKITLDERITSEERLRDYAEALLGDRPDYVFSHVTRTAVSKGLWRDLFVLEHLERAFRQTGKTAVLFVLSTEVPPRRPDDVREMERWWDWPVAHREGGNDLSHGEALFYAGVQAFNTRARQIKVLFVNQFGFERAVCGRRMPADLQFADLRRGTHLEFGQSIYEPFGIAQLEPLTFGGICVPSSVCGCVGFVEDVTGGREVPNVVIARYDDYHVPGNDMKALLGLSREERSRHERAVAEQVARRILKVLPTSRAQADELLASGCELAEMMSWNIVADQFILPAVDAICEDRPTIRVAKPA